MAETESKRGPGNEDVKFFVFRFRFFKEMSSVRFFNVDRGNYFRSNNSSERVDFWPKKRLSLGFLNVIT